MARVLNQRVHGRPAGSIYCGRPSVWGNPLVLGRDGDRPTVIAKYEDWLRGQPTLLRRLAELRGRDLVCWCAPLACHADVLLRLANAPRGGDGQSDEASEALGRNGGGVKGPLACPTGPATCRGVAPRLRPPVIVQGRVCSRPRRRFSSTGAAAAHFLVECDSLPDPRLRALAHRGTSIIDVTVWDTDALRLVDYASMNRMRYSIIKTAQESFVKEGCSRDEAAQLAGWKLEDGFIPQVRLGVRVAVEGTPRAGRWHPVGQRCSVPFGVVAERVSTLPRGEAVPA